jgi:hypothetical protein
VRGFRAAGENLSAEFDRVEAALLSQLAGQVAALLRGAQADDAAPDPVIARLLPDAYTDDPEASAEFRRFTSADLTERKVRNALMIVASVESATTASESVEVLLDGVAAQAWLRALTDIRLVLAARLGIEEDDDAIRADEQALILGDVYDWLGWMQESLLSALDLDG